MGGHVLCTPGVYTMLNELLAGHEQTFLLSPGQAQGSFT